MNLGHPERHPKLAREVGQHLEKMRQEAGISARDLSTQIAKHHLFFIGIEDGQEPLNVSDFVALVVSLGGDPVAVLQGIVKEFDDRRD